MKIYFLVLNIFLCSISYAQSYNEYIQKGKQYFNTSQFFKAWELFDLAYEVAETTDEKAEASKWKNISKKIIKERLIIAERSLKEVEKQRQNKILKDTLISRGDKCIEIKDYECAVNNLLAALGIDKSNIEILYKLDRCFLKLKDYSQAYLNAKKLMQLDSLNHTPFYNYSYYALFNNDYTGAIKAAKKSLQLNPDRNMVISNLAMAYILNNEFEKAEKIYKKYRSEKIVGYTNLAKDFFLNDIISLQKRGVKHKDFDKAKNLLE